jgi:precorrin-6B methylase 2
MHPQAKLVDFGAGSGVFSHLLALRGVPRKRIVAVELDQPTHGSPNQRQFFPLTRGYTIKPVDMLLLCWGH